MEVITDVEMWKGTSDDDLVFDYIQVLLRQGSRYYVAQQKDRFAPIRPENLTLEEIPDTFLYTPFPAGLTLAPDPFPENAYLKRPNYLDYGSIDNCCTILIQEAHIFEKLRLHPHKNIVQYHGCVAEKGMFHAICLERYPATLYEREEDLSETEKKRIVQDIREGIAHLHSIGLVHNDLNPGNVMIAEDGTAVLIDFDSCRPTGEPLGLKGATMGWGEPGPGEPSFGPPTQRRYAMPERDLRNLDQIEQYLLGHPADEVLEGARGVAQSEGRDQCLVEAEAGA